MSTDGPSPIAAPWVAAAAGLFAAALWAGGSVVSRHLSTAGIDPVDLALVRYAGCFPLAVGAAALWPAARPRIPAGRLAVLLLLGGPPYQALLLLGYGHASAGAGALVVTGLMPLVACLLTFAAASSGPARSAWAGALVAAAGVWIFARGLDAADLDLSGVLVFGTAAVMWALLSHCVRAWLIDPVALTVALALWSPLLLPVWIVATPGGLTAVPWENLALQAVYHGTIVAFGATALFFFAVRRLGPERAGCLQAATPGLAALLGAALLGEPLGLAQAAGAAVATLGLVIAVDGDRLARRLRAGAAPVGLPAA